MDRSTLLSPTWNFTKVYGTIIIKNNLFNKMLCCCSKGFCSELLVHCKQDLKQCSTNIKDALLFIQFLKWVFHKYFIFLWFNLMAVSCWECNAFWFYTINTCWIQANDIALWRPPMHSIDCRCYSSRNYTTQQQQITYSAQISAEVGHQYRTFQIKLTGPLIWGIALLLNN